MATTQKGNPFNIGVSGAPSAGAADLAKQATSRAKKLQQQQSTAELSLQKKIIEALYDVRRANKSISDDSKANVKSLTSVLGIYKTVVRTVGRTQSSFEDIRKSIIGAKRQAGITVEVLRKWRLPLETRKQFGQLNRESKALSKELEKQIGFAQSQTSSQKRVQKGLEQQKKLNIGIVDLTAKAVTGLTNQSLKAKDLHKNITEVGREHRKLNTSLGSISRHYRDIVTDTTVQQAGLMSIGGLLQSASKRYDDLAKSEQKTTKSTSTRKKEEERVQREVQKVTATVKILHKEYERITAPAKTSTAELKKWATQYEAFSKDLRETKTTLKGFTLSPELSGSVADLEQRSVYTANAIQRQVNATKSKVQQQKQDNRLATAQHVLGNKIYDAEVKYAKVKDRVGQASKVELRAAKEGYEAIGIAIDKYNRQQAKFGVFGQQVGLTPDQQTARGILATQYQAVLKELEDRKTAVEQEALKQMTDMTGFTQAAKTYHSVMDFQQKLDRRNAKEKEALTHKQQKLDQQAADEYSEALDRIKQHRKGMIGPALVGAGDITSVGIGAAIGGAAAGPLGMLVGGVAGGMYGGHLHRRVAHHFRGVGEALRNVKRDKLLRQNLAQTQVDAANRQKEHDYATGKQEADHQERKGLSDEFLRREWAEGGGEATLGAFETWRDQTRSGRMPYTPSPSHFIGPPTPVTGPSFIGPPAPSWQQMMGRGIANAAKQGVYGGYLANTPIQKISIKKQFENVNQELREDQQAQLLKQSLRPRGGLSARIAAANIGGAGGGGNGPPPNTPPPTGPSGTTPSGDSGWVGKSITGAASGYALKTAIGGMAEGGGISGAVSALLGSAAGLGALAVGAAGLGYEAYEHISSLPEQILDKLEPIAKAGRITGLTIANIKGIYAEPETGRGYEKIRDEFAALGVTRQMAVQGMSAYGRAGGLQRAFTESAVMGSSNLLGALSASEWMTLRGKYAGIGIPGMQLGTPTKEGITPFLKLFAHAVKEGTEAGLSTSEVVNALNKTVEIIANTNSLLTPEQIAKWVTPGLTTGLPTLRSGASQAQMLSTLADISTSLPGQPDFFQIAVRKFSEITGIQPSQNVTGEAASKFFEKIGGHRLTSRQIRDINEHPEHLITFLPKATAVLGEPATLLEDLYHDVMSSTGARAYEYMRYPSGTWAAHERRYRPNEVNPTDLEKFADIFASIESKGGMDPHMYIPHDEGKVHDIYGIFQWSREWREKWGKNLGLKNRFGKPMAIPREWGVNPDKAYWVQEQYLKYMLGHGASIHDIKNEFFGPGRKDRFGTTGTDYENDLTRGLEAFGLPTGRGGKYSVEEIQKLVGKGGVTPQDTKEEDLQHIRIAAMEGEAITLVNVNAQMNIFGKHLEDVNIAILKFISYLGFSKSVPSPESKVAGPPNPWVVSGGHGGLTTSRYPVVAEIARMLEKVLDGGGSPPIKPAGTSHHGHTGGW